MVLEKTLESPLDCKEIQPVNPKGNQSRLFIGRTDAETPILWPPDVITDSLEKTLMLGKIEGGRRRERQRMRWLEGTTDSMDMSFEKAVGVGDAIQPSHPLLSPSPPTFNLPKNQGLFQ